MPSISLPVAIGAAGIASAGIGAIASTSAANTQAKAEANAANTMEQQYQQKLWITVTGPPAVSPLFCLLVFPNVHPTFQTTIHQLSIFLLVNVIVVDEEEGVSSTILDECPHCLFRILLFSLR